MKTITRSREFQLNTYFAIINLPLITQWASRKDTANDEFYCMTIEEIEDIQTIANAKGFYFGYYRNSIGFKCQISKQSLDEPFVKSRRKKNEQ